MDGVEESFDHSTFSRNRQRLLEHEVAAKFLAEVVSMARGAADGGFFNSLLGFSGIPCTPWDRILADSFRRDRGGAARAWSRRLTNVSAAAAHS
jgi:hypothetical protein